jgi:hypothetical protein
MVKYVLLCLLRPELVGQDVEASSRRRVSNFQMNGCRILLFSEIQNIFKVLGSNHVDASAVSKLVTTT